MSDLLESVANSERDPYEGISNENMLARFKKANERISMRRDKWLESRSRKLDCKLCKIQEEILESCHECKANGAEISTHGENGPVKDAQDSDYRIEKILESKCCGAKTQSKLDTDCESCGEATPVEDLEMVLYRQRCYSSISKYKVKKNGRIITHRFEKSPLKFEGFDYKQIHCCKSPIYRRSQRLMECLTMA